MKSFAVKRDEKDPRWEKFKDFLRKKGGITFQFNLNYYGLSENGIAMGSEDIDKFDRIITLDEWEAEFVNKLAGSEYDVELINQLRKFLWVDNEIAIDINIFVKFLNQRYAKQDRISEIKAEIEKLSNELKELEKCLIN